jgi:hypothetical protein
MNEWNVLNFKTAVPGLKLSILDNRLFLQINIVLEAKQVSLFQAGAHNRLDTTAMAIAYPVILHGCNM